MVNMQNLMMENLNQMNSHMHSNIDVGRQTLVKQQEYYKEVQGMQAQQQPHSTIHTQQGSHPPQGHTSQGGASLDQTDQIANKVLEKLTALLNIKADPRNNPN
mmetsp:Transcript_10066/g.22117  ORF Transcript_10066/g.22117 Transcript_10066/m.22117 type:complete len:103 (-) Transcript_10066:1785-2093(-)